MEQPVCTSTYLYSGVNLESELLQRRDGRTSLTVLGKVFLHAH